MTSYLLCSQEQLIEMAALRGWISGPPVGEPQIDRLPAVEIFSRGQTSVLPEDAVSTQPSVCLRIPSAVIHGSNLSLFIEDRIFPGGLVHSPIVSASWSWTNDGKVLYGPGKLERLSARSPNLLGILSHWGHFFVDALDRVLLLDDPRTPAGPLLVSDPDFFSLQPKVDENFAVPQVSGLMRLAGVKFESGNFIALDKRHDYQVDDLTLWTLHSQKPAISSRSFRSLRDRVYERLSLDGRAVRAGGDLIYVGRSDIKKRFVLNQDAIVRFLDQAYSGRTIYPEHLSVTQSIEEFYRASRVILPAGSAKFNLIFCRPGTEVVCVMPKGYSVLNDGVGKMIRHLCRSMGLKLAFYDAEIPEQNKILLNSDMYLDEADVRRIMGIFDGMD